MRPNWALMKHHCLSGETCTPSNYWRDMWTADKLDASCWVLRGGPRGRTPRFQSLNMYEPSSVWEETAHPSGSSQTHVSKLLFRFDITSLKLGFLPLPLQTGVFYFSFLSQSWATQLKTMQSGAKSVVMSAGPEKPVWIPNLHYPSFQFGNECGCHCAASSPNSGGMKLHEASSGTLLYVLCRHLYALGSLNFHAGHKQIMRSSKCKVYSFTSHKIDSLEDELVVPFSLLQLTCAGFWTVGGNWRNWGTHMKTRKEHADFGTRLKPTIRWAASHIHNYIISFTGLIITRSGQWYFILFICLYYCEKNVPNSDISDKDGSENVLTREGNKWRSLSGQFLSHILIVGPNSCLKKQR